MRKSLVAYPARSLTHSLLLLLFGIAPVVLFGQPTPSPPVAVDPPPPFSDWRAFLVAAIKSDGLTGDDLPAWHLKASYKIFDEQGKAKEEGIFEEFQATPTRFKVTFTSPVFTQSTYGTDRPDRAVYISGASGSSQPWPLLLLWGAFVSPLPHEKDLKNWDLEEQEKSTPGSKISCLYIKTKATMATDFKSATIAGYCFDSGKTELRAEFVPYAKNGDLFTRTRLTSFHGRSIPADLQISRDGKIALTAHLESIEAVEKIDDALFVQPSDARLYPTMVMTPDKFPGASSFGVMGLGGGNQVPGSSGPSFPHKILISSNIAEGLRVKQVAPVYPPIAKAARVSGTVVLHAIIGKDGLISNLEVVSGAPMLQQAALDAVKQWVYKPYLVNGNPVEVDTTINVVFNLGGLPPQSAPPQP